MVTIYKKDHVKRKYARTLVTKISKVTCFWAKGVLHGYRLKRRPTSFDVSYYVKREKRPDPW